MEIARQIIMVGAPGSGKSTIGRKLANRLTMPFHDVDTLIEERVGKPISDIFVEDGEPVFRAEERAEIERVLTNETGVISLGGGAVVAPENRAVITAIGSPEREVVWLDLSVKEAARRVGFNRSRPLLLGNVYATLRKLMEERRPFYEQVATMTVAADQGTVAAVAARIHAQLLGEQAQPHDPHAPKETP